MIERNVRYPLTVLIEPECNRAVVSRGHCYYDLNRSGSKKRGMLAFVRCLGYDLKSKAFSEIIYQGDMVFYVDLQVRAAIHGHIAVFRAHGTDNLLATIQKHIQIKGEEAWQHSPDLDS